MKKNQIIAEFNEEIGKSGQKIKRLIKIKSNLSFD